jgi:hypothetical protein
LFERSRILSLGGRYKRDQRTVYDFALPLKLESLIALHLDFIALKLGEAWELETK